MSLASILSIARTALLTHQRAVNVTSHNIANASTEGYSRQRLPLRAQEPLRTPQGTLGRGVDAGAVERARDRFLDASYRRESGYQGEFATLRDLLGQVEGILGEPAEQGLGAGLDAFFDAWSDFANNPSGAAQRTLVRQNAIQLAGQFHGLDRRLTEIGDAARERLGNGVDQVNAIAQQIADLNPQILASHGGAADLEDRRDLLIDQLSQLVEVRVIQHDDGTVGVLAGSAVLVDGEYAQPLEAKSLPGGGWGIGYVGGSGTFSIGTGELQGLAGFLTTSLADVRMQLDTLARAVVSEVNTLHRQGITPGGLTNADFFDPAPPGGVTAASIGLAAAIADPGTGADAIAAGTFDPLSPTYKPGDGSLALRIAQLRTTAAGALGGVSLSEYYTRLVSGVAVSARSADQGAASQEAMVANVQSQRSSVQDVSIDEEMVLLMRQQQAFAAASRIVSTADEMMQDVLRMI